MKILLFAKDKPGLPKVRDSLRSFGGTLVEYIGGRGDRFPKAALGETSDLIISYLSPWIIPKSTLAKARLYALNFHPGPPSYPGTGCTNFALYDEVTEYGVTAHKMDPTVDTGAIVGVKRFPVLECDSVATLLEKSYEHLLLLFDEVVTKLIDGQKLSELDETWKAPATTRKELDALCDIMPTMSKEEVARRIRATYYSGMPGPKIDLFGYKFEYHRK